MKAGDFREVVSSVSGLFGQSVRFRNPRTNRVKTGKVVAIARGRLIVRHRNHTQTSVPVALLVD